MRKHFFSNLFVLAMALCATMNLIHVAAMTIPQKELQKVSSKKHYRLRKAGQVHWKTVSVRILPTTPMQTILLTMHFLSRTEFATMPYTM